MQLTTAALTTFALLTSTFAAPSPGTSTHSSASSGSSTHASPTPTNSPASTAAASKNYAPGWCTFHLELWVPDNGEWLVDHDPYKIMIPYILDDKHNKIGAHTTWSAVSGYRVVVDSLLPLTLLVASTGINTSGGVLNFSYGDDFWNSSSPQCSGLGGLSGNGFGSAISQLDCGFTCH